MSWYDKEQPTAFDSQPPEGFFYLDGDVVAVAWQQTFTKNRKFPMIAFPSGVECQLWESANYKAGIVHLFGEMDFPIQQSRDEAYIRAQSIAAQIGYVVQKVEANKLDLHGFNDHEHFRLTYDNQAKHILDIQPISPTETAKHPGHILMNADVQAKLPPLYTNEAIGLDALAPVKYFHPASQWTWYASEYDPEHRIFFGLVAGFEVELGSFTLDELEEIGRSGRTLPVERDLYYVPKTLHEMREMHHKLRGG